VGVPGVGTGHDPWIKHTIKSTGNFYEDIHAIDLNGDGHPDILCSVDGSVRWYQNPGGNGTGTWIEHYISDGTGHEIASRLRRRREAGLRDVPQPSHRLPEQSTSWTPVNYGGKYDGLALLDIGSGRGAINLIAENDSGIVWFENPRETWWQCPHGSLDPALHRPALRRRRPGPRPGGGRPQPRRPDGHNQRPERGVAGREHRADLVGGAGRPAQRYVDQAHHRQLLPGVHRIVPADIDNNGTIDLVLAEQEQSPQDRVAVFYNDGSGGFTQVVLETTGGQNNVVKDVDGDGDLDILSVNHGFYGARIRSSCSSTT